MIYEVMKNKGANTCLVVMLNKATAIYATQTPPGVPVPH